VKIPFRQLAAVGRNFIDLSPEVTAAILWTLEAGWEIARERTEVRTEAREVAMTECLRDGMREALNKGRLLWRRTMIVLPGTESRSRSCMTMPDGRTDIPLLLIPIFRRSGEHDPHAIVECKRIAERDATLVREYVTEGIDRFCTGKYASSHSR
jgi:hypothetical protein